MDSPGHWTNNLDLFLRYISVDIMGYKQWIIKNNQEYCVEENDYNSNWRFSNLTLYLMGIIGPESVRPIQVHEFEKKEGNDVYNDWGPSCQDEHKFTVSYNVSIQDIISNNGVRIPSSVQSKKDFNVGFVNIIPYNGEVDYEYIKYLKEYMRSDEWYNLTRSRKLLFAVKRKVKNISNKSKPLTQALLATFQLLLKVLFMLGP